MVSDGQRLGYPQSPSTAASRSAASPLVSPARAARPSLRSSAVCFSVAGCWRHGASADAVAGTAAAIRSERLGPGDPHRRVLILRAPERRVVRRHIAGGTVGGGDERAVRDLYDPGELAGALRHVCPR